MLGAGLLGAGVAAGMVLLRRCGRDARARRLIAGAERLIDRIEAAIAEHEKPTSSRRQSAR